jgi:NADH:ubiquinone oxidoreductase subunit F (NADH-binding)
MPHLLPDQPIRSLDEYFATDVGGLGIQRATQIGPRATIAEVLHSGLRGRGGGGFPTGRKWAGVREEMGTHHYMVANAAEGEPGTFKDRMLLRQNPYQFVEGLVIAAYAIGAVEAFIGLKASFEQEIEALQRAIVEMQEAGICADCRMTIARGPEEYLFGEETALLEVIEGHDPLPRVLRPYELGLFATAPQTGWESTDQEPGHAGPHVANPTAVNNVETLSNVPHILAHGADWFRSIGTKESAGTQICTVLGDVRHAGVGEFAMGTPLAEVIEHVSGGPSDGRAIKAVFSGVANPVVTAEHLDVALSYEGFEAIGSGMGAGGFIVLDDTACMVEVARVYSQFLYVESCAQCPACKRGSGEITRLLQMVQDGEASTTDVGQMGGWLERVTDGNRCYLPIEERELVSSLLRAFPDEFTEHIETGRCPLPREIVVPKLVDIVDGVALYDTNQARKLPDWTYAQAP